MSKQEKRRLERLKKELDNQQKKLDEDKKKFAAQKKALRESKLKLERQQKQLQQKVRKFQLSSSPASPGGTRSRNKGGGSSKANAELNKTKGELKDTKDQLEKAKKSVRELRKSVDDKEALIKSLQRQLKKAGRSKKAAFGDDKIIKQLKREIANLKKRLKLALRDLDKQARYYQQQLKRFKQDQQKWINRQRDLHKNKGVVVKYVFIDDIRKIKVYKKGKNRIKIKTVDGGEVIIKDVQIVEASEVEEAADDMIDEVTKEIDAEFKKKKKKKRKKGDPVDMDDDDEEPQNLDDIKDDADDIIKFEDHTDEIYGELMEEISSRTKDLHRVNEIYCNDEEDAVQDTQFKELWESVIGRHEKWTAKLTDDLNYDYCDELPELSKKWQDEIYKVKDSVIIIRRRARKRGKKEGIDEAKQQSAYGVGVSNDENDSKLQNEVQYLAAAKDQMITELNGRISDLTQLNGIYFHPESSSSILSKSQQVQELVNNLEIRHEGIINELSELPPSANAIDELLPENNDQWKSLIYATGQELNDNDAEPLRLELELRTKDLDRAVKVVTGDEPPEVLSDLVSNIQHRTDEAKKEHYDRELTQQQEAVARDQAEWLAIMKALEAANAELTNQLNDARAQAEAARLAADQTRSKTPLKDYGPTSSAQKMVIRGLLSEMDDRRQDLNNLSNLHVNADGDGDAVTQAEKLRVDAIKRHQAQNSKLQQDVRALSAAAKASGNMEGDQDIQDALRMIEADNKKWQNQLNKLVDDTKNVDDLKKRSKAAMQELNGRIADVIKLKNLYDSANDAGNSNSRQEAERQFESLQNSVRDRHDDVEQDMKEAIDSKKAEDRQQLKDMTENDEDWRDAIFNTASHITELDEPAEPEPAKEKPQYAEVKAAEAAEMKIAAPKREAVYDDEQKEWWLDKDAKRRAFIDSIACDEKQTDDIVEIASYCDRVLYHPNTDDMGVATDLYFPIPAQDNHHILSVFYDGTMLCDLISRIDDDYMDKRVINYPDPFDPYPLSDKAVLENASLLLSAARSLGVEMTTYDVEDWMDAASHSAMLIELVDGLAQKLLTSRMNLKSAPELCRLIKNGEEVMEVEGLTGQQWLARWLNQKNGKGLVDEVAAPKWNNATFGAMKAVSPIFNNAAPCAQFQDDAAAASMAMVTHVTNKSAAGTTVRPSDLGAANFGKVHRYFSSEAYFTKSGLSALSSKEENSYQKYLTKQKKSDEDTYANWINAMLPSHLHVSILTRDLSDGVVLLKLLEKGKDGCVNWKKAREKVRHKFDKLNNCNMVLALSQSAPFNFRLVGMGGNDIVDGQQKFVSTLLWLLMRYQAVKQISELSFGGKTVTDQDILQWANVTIVRNAEAQSKQIGNFKDRQLTSCIFYTELLAAIRPNDVDLTLLNYEVRPLVNNRVDDKFRRERLDNARLAMSYVRKFGADLFVLPEHLIGMDSKAVLSMFAAIMTVGMTDYGYAGKKKGSQQIDDAMMGY